MNKSKPGTRTASLEPLSPRERGRGEGPANAQAPREPEPSSGAARRLPPKGEGKTSARHPGESRDPLFVHAGQKALDSRFRGNDENSNVLTSIFHCALPSTWTRVPLANVCLPTKQWNPSKSTRERFTYIDVSAISRESCTIFGAQTIHAKDAPSRARKIIHANDTIYATIRPTLRRIAFVEREYHDQIASTAFCIIRPDTTKAIPRFVYFALQTDSVNDEIARFESGASYPAVNDKHVLGCEIPLPPKPEQQKIAAVLWKLQRAIVTQDRLLAATADLKQSAMQRLFTYGLHGEPLKDTEIGPMPESWIEKPLGDIAEIEYGAQAAVANATDPSIGTPILTNINITNDGQIDTSLLRYYAVPPKHVSKLELRKGDVLFNWRSGSSSHVGKTALFDLDGEYTYSSFILRFRPKQAVTSGYLHGYLNFIKKAGFFSRRRNVSSINSVFNASLSATIPVLFPADLDEQRAIAAALATIDRKLAHHRAKRAALHDLFETLLHKLMTAEIRVADLDIDTSEVEPLAAQGEPA